MSVLVQVKNDPS